MGTCYINATTEIPNVYSETMTPEISGDEARTEGNALRFDAVDNNVKRVWQLRAYYLTQTQFNVIYNYLKSVNFGIVSFWIDSMDGTAAANSINVKISELTAERVQFQSATGWETKGRNIDFRATEQ